MQAVRPESGVLVEQIPGVVFANNDPRIALRCIRATVTEQTAAVLQARRPRREATPARTPMRQTATGRHCEARSAVAIQYGACMGTAVAGCNGTLDRHAPSALAMTAKGDSQRCLVRNDRK